MKGLKVGAVIFGAIVVTALGIDAADTLNGSGSTLLGQIIATDIDACPMGMVVVPTATTFTCADKFEASASESCDSLSPASPVDTATNLASNECISESREEKAPWRFITRENAQLACVRSGKRLPTAAEWHILALGTPDGKEQCNINEGNVSETGTKEECVSVVGVHDAVGNVWEWTTDDIFNATYLNRPLPESGYVTQVDSGGVATVSSVSSEGYGADYFWSKKEGVYAMARGGFYGSRSDAGVYAVHAAMDPNMEGAAVGFRCIK